MCLLVQKKSNLGTKITVLSRQTPVWMRCCKLNHVSSTTNNFHNKLLSEPQYPMKHLKIIRCEESKFKAISLSFTNHHSQSHQICGLLLYQDTLHLGYTRIVPFLGIWLYCVIQEVESKIQSYWLVGDVGAVQRLKLMLETRKIKSFKFDALN